MSCLVNTPNLCYCPKVLGLSSSEVSGYELLSRENRSDLIYREDKSGVANEPPSPGHPGGTMHRHHATAEETLSPLGFLIPVKPQSMSSSLCKLLRYTSAQTWRHTPSWWPGFSSSLSKLLLKHLTISLQLAAGRDRNGQYPSRLLEGQFQHSTHTLHFRLIFSCVKSLVFFRS